jgi:hypothetical protein
MMYPLTLALSLPIGERELKGKNKDSLGWKPLLQMLKIYTS